MPKGKTRFWLSFDVSLSSSYKQLFAWLDDHDAGECGDNVATFTSEKYFEDLQKEIAATVGEGGSRVYLIGRTKKPANGLAGKFIVGRRKAQPWAGFGRISSSDEADNDG